MLEDCLRGECEFQAADAVAASLFRLTRYSSARTATRAAVGTATSAPKTPAREPPRESAMMTARGDSCRVDLMMRGWRKTASNCAYTAWKMITPRTFWGESSAATEEARTRALMGPTMGTILATPANMAST